MLVNIHHDTRAEHRRLVYAGIGFMTAVALLIAGSIAIYQKVFTPVTMVTVKADRAGLQLPKFGDVRIHGVLVGQVRSVSQDGHQAVIKLGLDPSEARRIPDNVTVEIRPTTLFGQKYVSFVDPPQPSSTPLRDGAVIPASRVTTSVELQHVLATLFPLLRSIRPGDINSTLYALATALQGRGDQLGRTVDDLDSYLAAMNVQLPTLRKDLQSLASVSQTYALAAPDLVDLLKNATTTARTVVQEQHVLSGFFSSMTSLSQVSTRILTTNEKGIIQEGQVAAPLMKLLDTYSPEYTCLLQGADRYTGRLAEIFKGNRVRQSMSWDAAQRRAYTTADRPQYGEIGHGPWCLGLPNPAVPSGFLPLRNGTHLDEPGRH
ncbi:MCE family protein [Nocardioides pocheonensis]|uniref:MCE family protein n=1 Tax=Nocardioides pocheonensis TaxID=661485 RepID=A0A3N0GUH7_9ACTN|nr:MCE family protein [Nocardioides pocheonensis]RNM16123.1 MCE family protein [Nocardioides pocheonensis]